jgi:hypothetical protein
VFIFYGDGGRFEDPAFDRWYAALGAASDLLLYVGGAGHDFTFDAAERARGTALFKHKKLRFAVVTENVRHRLLGSTGRLVGMDLHLYSWKESRLAFGGLAVSAAIVDELHRTLFTLRAEVARELEKASR